MPGDGQSDEFVEKIFCKVATAHVRELMGQSGGEVFVREICEQRWREDNDAVTNPDGGRAGDGGACGELCVVNAEDASAALPAGEGLAGESDGLCGAAESARAVQAVEQARSKIGQLCWKSERKRLRRAGAKAQAGRATSSRRAATQMRCWMCGPAERVRRAASVATRKMTGICQRALSR